jgi:hypothetical protein
MAYLGTKPANQVIDSTLIADGTITPSDLSTGKPVWDTSGNVGIGTNSPADKLEVNGIIRSNTLRTGATHRTLELYSGTAFNTGGAAVALRGISTGYNDGGMEFYTGAGAGGSERMRIDSSGRVTTPFQPAFMATRVGGAVAINTDVVWDAAVLNRGSHYSTATGRFTAPIAGVYAFWWRGDNATTNGLQMGLRLNGSVAFNGVDYAGFGWNGSSASGHASGFVVVQLNANDYVYVRNEGYGALQGDPGYNNGFGGFLIG